MGILLTIVSAAVTRPRTGRWVIWSIGTLYVLAYVALIAFLGVVTRLHERGASRELVFRSTRASPRDVHRLASVTIACIRV